VELIEGVVQTNRYAPEFSFVITSQKQPHLGTAVERVPLSVEEPAAVSQ
jgi:hypothetical protein